MRINCAGGPYRDPEGKIWIGDLWFEGGIESNPQIDRADDHRIYRKHRFFQGPGGYHIPLPRGSYRVTLHFVENWPGAEKPGVRVFDVRIEGEVVLKSFDVSGEAGFATPLAKGFPVEVDDELLDIDFDIGPANYPFICAIEIERAEG